MKGENGNNQIEEKNKEIQKKKKMKRLGGCKQVCVTRGPKASLVP